MTDYMGQVKTLLAMYVPPDPQRMQQAAQAEKVSLNTTVGSGTAQIVFKDYALPGDQMTISLRPSLVAKISHHLTTLFCAFGRIHRVVYASRRTTQQHC